MSREKNLSQEEIIKIAAKTGADAALVKFEQQRKQEDRHWSDRRFRNTKMLLSNYRDFKEYSLNAIYDAEQSDECVDIMDMMWGPHNRAEQIVESIKRSAVRTKIIMTHIEGMLSTYSYITLNTKNPAERRRYDVLYDRYISEEQITIDEIALKYSIEPRTVYMDIEAAIERMSRLIFGIDYILRGRC